MDQIYKEKRTEINNECAFVIDDFLYGLKIDSLYNDNCNKSYKIGEKQSHIIFKYKDFFRLFNAETYVRFKDTKDTYDKIIKYLNTNNISHTNKLLNTWKCMSYIYFNNAIYFVKIYKLNKLTEIYVHIDFDKFDTHKNRYFDKIEYATDYNQFIEPIEIRTEYISISPLAYAYFNDDYILNEYLNKNIINNLLHIESITEEEYLKHLGYNINKEKIDNSLDSTLNNIPNFINNIDDGIHFIFYDGLKNNWINAIKDDTKVTQYFVEFTNSLNESLSIMLLFIGSDLPSNECFKYFKKFYNYEEISCKFVIYSTWKETYFKLNSDKYSLKHIFIFNKNIKNIVKNKLIKDISSYVQTKDNNSNISTNNSSQEKEKTNKPCKEIRFPIIPEDPKAEILMLGRLIGERVRILMGDNTDSNCVLNIIKDDTEPTGYKISMNITTNTFMDL